MNITIKFCLSECALKTSTGHLSYVEKPMSRVGTIGLKISSTEMELQRRKLLI